MAQRKSRRRFALPLCKIVASETIGAPGGGYEEYCGETTHVACVGGCGVCGSGWGGARCDFDYRIRYRLVFNDLIWGHFERVISHGTAYVAHTNLDTGYTLRERDRSVMFINEGTGKGKTVGILWKLRT